MQTTSEQFHSMRGHVSEGCIITSPSGREYTLKNHIGGWMVHANTGGLAISGYLPSARDVETFVVYGLQNS